VEKALFDAICFACSKSRPMFEDALSVIDGKSRPFIDGTLTWALMVVCAGRSHCDDLVQRLPEAGSPLDGPKWADLEHALVHLSQMALCWRPFQLPPPISSALASILERLPVQLSGHPDDSSSSTVASREDE
jgi:hypothetical protein